MSESTKILVIDDEEIVHASVRRILTRLGFEVDSSFSAQDGLDRMSKNHYDAAITDLMMPEMNGVEMLHAMKERGINLPTIMITGYPTIKTAMQALRLGATDYIPKPFTRQELLSPLNRALRRCGDSTRPDCEDNPFSDRDRMAKGGVQINPGDVFFLPEHSWAIYNQDGTIDIGVEASFLALIPKVDEIESPGENDLVEQGYPGFKLKASGEVHGVFMPLSGRVVANNKALLSKPELLDSKTWVLKIIPSQLNEELGALSKLK